MTASTPARATAQPTLDLLYGDVEDEVRASVRKMLADRCDAAAVVARTESDEPYDTAAWRTLAAEMGLAGLLVPERLGGAGASAREVAVVLEEVGRTVAPVPYLGSAVLATSALLACDDGAQGVPELVSGLASGRRTGTLAVPLSAASGGFRAVDASSGALRGRVTSVPDLEAADLVVVPATDEDGPALYALDVPAPGLAVSPRVPLDLTRRLADLDLDRASGTRVASGHDAERALASAWRAGAGLLPSEMLGVAEWCLDTTVAYVSGRYQFGRPVGSFQALKHRLADLWATVSTARAAARAAADALATRASDTNVLVAVAQAYGSDAVVLAAEEALQLHGGIGMTWEHPVHLYVGRAKSAQLAFGTPERHLDRLATLLDLPAPGESRPS
ncbi:MAG: acyl-CoA dehydrogenase family protein [Actinomycetes bacterium]